MAQLEEIYHKYFKDVFLYIYSLSGDQHIAEDMTSETFLKAIKSIDRFQGKSDLRVWLCQIAKNSYYSYLRKNKGLVEIDTLPEPASESNIENAIISTEASMKVHEILQQLKEPYREVFSLRVFGELTFKQIGKLYGKSENWACVTYHRARRKIKEEMGDYR